MYREVLRSLEDEETTCLIDDYLSGSRQLRRNSTRCGANAVHYTLRGLDHSRPVTYLITTKANYSDSFYSTAKRVSAGDRECLRSVAQKLVSGALAMREISEDTDQQPPIDVSFIILGGRQTEQGYKYLDLESLKNAIMADENSIRIGTHLVIIESTGLRVCNVHKGCLIFKLCVEGLSHSPSFAWLGDNPWEALIRFEKILDDLMKPMHNLYPLEFGKSLPSTLSSFLMGYPTMAITRINSNQPRVAGAGSSIEFRHYVSLPPEFSVEDLKKKLLAIANATVKGSGCRISINEEFLEEPYHEDPHSPIVGATSEAFKKLVGFEPIFEWLPFPVAAKELKASGFAEDVVAFGPGDWTPGYMQGERSIIDEILKAAGILAKIPHEVAELDRNRLD